MSQPSAAASGSNLSKPKWNTTYIFLLVALIGLILISGIMIPETLKLSHLLEMSRQTVPLGITAIGQTFVIITGGIDLSVGEVITMTNIVATDLMRGRSETALPVIALLLFLGALVGFVNGFIISKTNVPPLVMTFGMASAVKGSYLLYSGGAPKGSVSPILRTIGAGRIGIVPISLILFAIVATGAVFFLRKTTIGHSLFFLGSNRTAARYSGIPIDRRTQIAYALSGFCAAMTGLILSGYIGIGNFDIGGDPYMLNSIAATVIGGNTFFGEGGLGGTILGSFIITVLGSIMTSLGIGESGKLIMRGSIIVVMVALYLRQRQPRVKKG